MSGSEKKISLASAAQSLEELADRIEDVEQVGSLLSEIFTDKRLALKESIDRRIAALMYLKGAIPAAKELKDMYAARQKKLERIDDWLRENTVYTMQQFPDLPYEGTNEQFKVQEHHTPALKINLKLRTSSHIVSDKDAFDIPVRYLKEVFELDTRALTEDIKLNFKPEWASYEKSKFLKIKPKGRL